MASMNRKVNNCVGISDFEDLKKMVGSKASQARLNELEESLDKYTRSDYTNNIN